MKSSGRFCLSVVPDDSSAARLARLVPSEQLALCHDWSEAKQLCIQRLPDVLLAPCTNWPEVFTFVQDYHHALTVALFGPVRLPALAKALMQAAAAGHVFTAVDDSGSDEALGAELRSLFTKRTSGRAPAPSGMTARVADLDLEATVLDIGNFGFGLRISADDSPERFLWGTELGPMTLEHNGRVVLEAPLAYVRHIAPCEDGCFRLGLELHTETKRTPPSLIITDAPRIAAAFRRMLRRGERVMLGPVWQPGSGLAASVTDVDPTQGRVTLRLQDGALKVSLEPHDVVRLACDLGGMVYEAHVSVVRREDHDLLVALPRVLRRQHRRELVRIVPPEHFSFAVALRLPFTGGQLFRPVLDAHQRGLSFAFDAEREILPVGTHLDEIELVLPDHARVTCAAVVRSIGGLLTGPAGFARPKRCGLELLQVPVEARRALVSTLLAAHHPRLEDATTVPFPQIWTLMAEAGAGYPDYPPGDGPHVDLLGEEYARSTRGDPGLARGCVYKSENGTLLGHGAGLRYYSRTWTVQHLASIGAKEHSWGVARELSSYLYEYPETSDSLEFITCLWREGTVWVHRFSALVSRGICNDALSSVRSFFYMRLPREEPVPTADDHAASCIRPMSDGDREEVANVLRRRYGPLRLRANDFVFEELQLATVGSRYRAAGFERRREVWCGYDGSTLVGLALLESTTPGLCWPELTNAFSLVVAEPAHPDKDRIMRALVARAVTQSRSRPLPTAIGLVDESERQWLLDAGFRDLGKLYEWTTHRSTLRHWLNLGWSAIESRVPLTSKNP